MWIYMPKHNLYKANKFMILYLDKDQILMNLINAS